MTRNEAVFTYSGDEPTVDHAGDLVIDRALDILEKQLDVQLKQLDIIRASLTTRIFVREGTSIRPVDYPPEPHHRAAGTCAICKRWIHSIDEMETNLHGSTVHKSCNAGTNNNLKDAISAGLPCYACDRALDRTAVTDWYGYRHDGCPIAQK